MNPEFTMTMRGACAFLHVTRNTLYLWMKSGKIPPHCYTRFSKRKVLFNRQALDKFLWGEV